LTLRLGEQLAQAKSPGEAFLALEGLLLLDAEASLEIARGLQHPDTQVARTAYRTLDAQVTRWQQLEPAIATSRMRNLVQRLNDLPATTPADNLLLASSLASRVFALCLQLEDPQLAPVMTLCENVLQRTGAAQLQKAGTQVDETSAVAQILGPLPPAPLAVTATVSDDSLESPLPEQQFTQTSVEQARSFPTNALRPEPDSVSRDSTNESNAASGIVAPLVAREALHSSSSTPMARVQFLTSATRPRSAASAMLVDAASPVQALETSFSLSDNSPNDNSPNEDVVDDSANNAYLGSDPLGSVPAQQISDQATTPASYQVVGGQIDLREIPSMGIDQLVRLLASVQPRVAQEAAMALRAQQMPDDRLALASDLATSAPVRRIQLINEIARRDDLDPRPWLLWMAEDGEAEVRLQAITLISSMADTDVHRHLRRLLHSERDAIIAHAMRQVLAAGPKLSLR
jgi:hypothetical protein